MTTLGQILANNVASELNNSVPPGMQAERERQEYRKRVDAIGNRFFEKAWKYFTDGIMAATPTANLRLQVGGEQYTMAEDYHNELDGELNWFDVEGFRHYDAGAHGGELPVGMQDPDRFASHWAEFQRWANTNGLEAYWKLGRGGVMGWWNLYVRPAQGIVAAK